MQDVNRSTSLVQLGNYPSANVCEKVIYYKCNLSLESKIKYFTRRLIHLCKLGVFKLMVENFMIIG